ncbi:MAG: zinc ribbon domain-containing protein [Spirochaetaceae bacterium]|nr:MAG: zinc ribbon domain-containing protein [Spirochaetaceae bacterium]
MPTYEYECSSCAHRFEELQSMSAPALEVCPSCGKPSLRRLVGGGIGIIFKGSGFYVNDSKKKSSSSNGAGKTSSSPAATSTAAAGAAGNGSSGAGSSGAGSNGASKDSGSSGTSSAGSSGSPNKAASA